MGRLPWYKAEPRAFFDATRGWSNELKANYRLIIDLIYAHDGALPDDERWVAGELGCDVRVWRRLRIALIERDKLYVADGCLRNPRADKEVTSALAKHQLTVTAGLASAEKRAKSKDVSAENNDLGGTDVSTERQLIEKKNKKEKIPPVSPDGETSPVPRRNGGAQVRAAMEVWNEVAGDVLPKVQKLTAQRERLLRQRLADDCHGDLAEWRSYCERIRASPFCCGDNERGWRADLDFAVNAGNWAKVVEGKYDPRPSRPSPRGRPPSRHEPVLGVRGQGDAALAYLDRVNPAGRDEPDDGSGNEPRDCLGADGATVVYRSPRWAERAGPGGTALDLLPAANWRGRA
jgi:hypothetical protein